jgi:hypothetical protein
MMEMREVQLPADLCAAIEKKLGERFGNLEELLVYILSDLAGGDASESDYAEQRIIEERLRELGYI